MASSTDASRAKILIVDDQDSNLRLLEFVLCRGGFLSVTSTSKAAEVCELHRVNRYDLILLDLRMPVMNGFAVMAALGKTDPPAILVHSADPAQMVSALEAGASGFISKPFVLADVVSRVRSLLETKEPVGVCAA